MIYVLCCALILNIIIYCFPPYSLYVYDVCVLSISSARVIDYCYIIGTLK